MKTFDKLAVKIERDLDIKLTDFRRTYAGIHQRGSGAFVWVARLEGSNEEIGSTITASELLTREKITEMETPTYSSLREFI